MPLEVKSRLVQVMAWCNKETRHCLSHSYQPIMTCNIPMVQWVNQLKRRQYEQKDLANKNKFDRENPSLLFKIIVNPSCHLSDLVQSWYLVVSFLQMNQKRCPICCLYGYSILGIHSLKEVLSFLPFILCSISCHIRPWYIGTGTNPNYHWEWMWKYELLMINVGNSFQLIHCGNPFRLNPHRPIYIRSYQTAVLIYSGQSQHQTLPTY